MPVGGRVPMCFPLCLGSDSLVASTISFFHPLRFMNLLAACTSGAFFRLCFAQAVWPQLRSPSVSWLLAGFWLEDVIGICSMVNKCNKPFCLTKTQVSYCASGFGPSALHSGAPLEICAFELLKGFCFSCAAGFLLERVEVGEKIQPASR